MKTYHKEKMAWYMSLFVEARSLGNDKEAVAYWGDYVAARAKQLENK